MASPKDSQSVKPWLRYLLHPSWMAGVISIGFHGVLFASGPTFSTLRFNTLVQPELLDSQRQVPLVELTAAEQQRLPDFSNAFYSFEDFNRLGDAFGNASGKLDLPTSTVPNANSRIAASSPPSASPSSGETPTTPSTPLGFNAEPFQSRWQQWLTSPPLPPITSTVPAQPRVSPPPQPPLPDGALPSLPGSITEAEAALLESLERPLDTPEIPAGEPSAAEPSAADLIRDPENPTPDAGSESASSPEDIAAATGEAPRSLLQELLRQRQVYAYNRQGTSEAEAEVRSQAWSEEGKTLANSLPDTPESSLAPIEQQVELPPFEYGQSPCLPTAPHSGVIGLWLSPDGEILGEPALLKSTGYGFINQQALESIMVGIQAGDVVTDDRLVGYQFQFDVNYDPEVCIDLRRQTVRQETGADFAPLPSSEAATPESDADAATQDTNQPTNTVPGNAPSEAEDPSASGRGLEPEGAPTSDVAQDSSPKSNRETASD